MDNNVIIIMIIK